MLALSDSDMAVDKEYLRRIVGEFEECDKTGIVTSLYKYRIPRRRGAPSNPSPSPSTSSRRCSRPPPGRGHVRPRGLHSRLKEALREIGGFDALKEYLADDYQLGFRLWQRGYENAISRYVIENRVGPMSVAAIWPIS